MSGVCQSRSHGQAMGRCTILSRAPSGIHHYCAFSYPECTKGTAISSMDKSNIIDGFPDHCDLAAAATPN